MNLERDRVVSPEGRASGRLLDNLGFFARVLRRAGLPVGTAAAAEAAAALAAVGFESREDLRAALHAVFVKSHTQTPVFDAAFAAVWRRHGAGHGTDGTEGLLADADEQRPPPAGSARVADALAAARPPQRAARPGEIEQVAVSDAERLRTRDFAQMSAAEVAAALDAIAGFRFPDDERATRRWRPSRSGRSIDARASLRQTMRRGGDVIALPRRQRRQRPVPVVALCDISGSMSEYVRIFLHFLHRLGARRPVQTFLFGTRLSNCTRALRLKDVDAALADCAAAAPDWSGGTRIAASLTAFNRVWARRVLGQGAIVLLFTDGLERDGTSDLAREADRLRRSCRRLIWLNPLLRFAAFQPKAAGVRALLPNVDSFRPIHDLRAMEDLVSALAADDRAARRALSPPTGAMRSRERLAISDPSQ